MQHSPSPRVVGRGTIAARRVVVNAVALGAIVIAAAATGCMGPRGQAKLAIELDSQIRRFSILVRAGRWSEAAQLVVPARREAFVEYWEAREEKVRPLDFTIEGLSFKSPDDSSYANVRVVYEETKQAGTVVSRRRFVLTWIQVRNVWLLEQERCVNPRDDEPAPSLMGPVPEGFVPTPVPKAPDEPPPPPPVDTGVGQGGTAPAGAAPPVRRTNP